MPNVVINDSVYNGVPAVDIPLSGTSGKARFYYTGDADVASADVLAGKTGYGAAGQVSGGMVNNGATGGVISTKAGTVTIPAGFTSGGSVAISQAEQDKIIPANIKAGVTLLGQQGSLTSPTISQNSTTKILSIS